MGIKNTLTILLTSCSFLAFSQVERFTADSEFKGPIKSVTTYGYITNDSDENSHDASQQNILEPTCEVCEHYEKFDKKGKLVEKQEYVIIEPVSDLGMGYCLHLDFEYKKKVLVLITAKKFAFHDMDIWGYDEESSAEDTVYSITKNGEITTTEYIDQWEVSIKKQYKNGLLIKDEYQDYFYNKNGQLIKRSPHENGSTSNQRIETWEYAGDLLQEYTSLDTVGFFFGSQTQYFYYPSGKLFSEKDYNLSGPNKTDEKELRSIKYYYEDGRDSLHQFLNIYSKIKEKRNFKFEYLFHSNGVVSTKTQKTEAGEICGFETFDSKGNLTQFNSYNTSLEAYKIDRYIYNEKNELIEMHVVDDYNGEEYSMIYEYDKYGNETHAYYKNGDLMVLAQKQIFEYYR